MSLAPWKIRYQEINCGNPCQQVRSWFVSDPREWREGSLLLSNRSKGYGDGRSSQSHRLGELLISAGILRADKLPEALQVAKKTGAPIGRVLVMFGGLKEADIDAALEIQRLIRNATIAADLGIQALHEASSDGTPVEETLQKSGYARDYVVRNALGELLVSAGMLTRPQLTEAIRMSTQVGMTLGKYLSLTGAIATPVLFAALNAQVAVRDKKISRDQAILQLKEAAIKRTAISVSVVSQSHGNSQGRSDIRLGELLSLAQIISENDILSAVEMGLFKEQPVGKVLVESRLIPDSLIEPAVQLQEMVHKRELRPAQAAEVLLQVHRRSLTLEQSLSELGLHKKKIDGWREALELLKSAGLLGDHNFRALVDRAEAAPDDVARAIEESQIVDELIFQAALRCQRLLKEKRLRFEQAVIALHYCQRSRSNLDEALSDLAFS